MEQTVPGSTHVECVVCAHTIPFEAATAGALYAGGQQAFACSNHVIERLLWTMAWIGFETEQRRLTIKAAAMEVA